jgi:hypothetical protein
MSLSGSSSLNGGSEAKARGSAMGKKERSAFFLRRVRAGVIIGSRML